MELPTEAHSHPMVVPLLENLGLVHTDAFAVKMACAGMDPSSADSISAYQRNERRLRALIRGLGLEPGEAVTWESVRLMMISVLKDCIVMLED